jgi:hypothetical protein
MEYTSARHRSFPESEQSSQWLPTHFLKMHSNNVLPSMPRSSKWSIPFSSPNETPYAFQYSQYVWNTVGTDLGPYNRMLCEQTVQHTGENFAVRSFMVCTPVKY